MIEVDANYLVFILVSVILPMIVALVTRQNTSSAVKAYVLLGLSAISSTLWEIYNTGISNLDDQSLVNLAVNTVVAFITAAGTHAGLLKPAHVTGAEGVIAQKTEPKA